MITSLFNISDLSRENLFEILQTNEKNLSLQGKSIGLLFEKYSTRTRLSFSVGIAQLGGNTVDIRYEELNISRDESFEDTFRAMNCYLDGLVFRTKDHHRLISASKYFKKPIINALSDISHPCQTLGDILTLKEHFGTLKLDILWIGDMNNVCYSLIEASNLIDEINLTICAPLEISNKIKWHMNNNIKIINDLNSLKYEDFNCVMTDVFISMNDKDDLNKIDILKDYTVSDQLMNKTNNDCVFMHCLPAKVGFEVSEGVIRGKKSIVWNQAYNRMISQKKLLTYIFEYLN